MNKLTIVSYVLLTALTAAYCILLWYGAGIWAITFIHADYGNIPLLSQIFLAPLPLPLLWTMIHWQLIAVTSLCFCIYYGVHYSHKDNNNIHHIHGIAVHSLWILLAMCCHLMGAVLPMLAIGHII